MRVFNSDSTNICRIAKLKERRILHNLLIDHVMIWSELRYLICAQVVRFDCWVVGGETGPIATVQVVGWWNSLQLSGSGLEPDPELDREFRTIAHMKHMYALQDHHYLTVEIQLNRLWLSEFGARDEVNAVMYLDTVN